MAVLSVILAVLLPISPLLKPMLEVLASISAPVGFMFEKLICKARVGESNLPTLLLMMAILSN